MEGYVLGLIVVFLMWLGLMYFALRNNKQFISDMFMLKAFIMIILDRMKGKLARVYHKLTQSVCEAFKRFK